jgi:CheY-like chemotaxis protein
MGELLAGKRVFVVEDDPVNLAVISSLLREHGAIVRFDTWGSSTLARMDGFHGVDIILMDLMLPGQMTGYDVFDMIKEVETLANVPIVIVSASDPDIGMKKAREKGFNGYICKPIRRSTFVRSLVKILDGHPVWGELDE